MELSLSLEKLMHCWVIKIKISLVMEWNVPEKYDETMLIIAHTSRDYSFTLAEIFANQRNTSKYGKIFIIDRVSLCEIPLCFQRLYIRDIKYNVL